MSGADRQVDRLQKKDAYKRFKRSWGQERVRQSEPGAVLKAGEHRLGKCPTLPQWNKMVEQALKTSEDKLKEQQKKIEEKVDLEWKEDT